METIFPDFPCTDHVSSVATSAHIGTYSLLRGTMVTVLTPSVVGHGMRSCTASHVAVVPLKIFGRHFKA